MLVLQRKQGQTIVIGNDVVLHISRLRGNSVTVAIEAPRELTIRRGELDDRMDPETTKEEQSDDTRIDARPAKQCDDERRVHFSVCVDGE